MNQAPNRSARRAFFAGAAGVGAAATATRLLPGTQSGPAEAEVAPKPAPERGGGYSLSEHVQRYYRSARV